MNAKTTALFVMIVVAVTWFGVATASTTSAYAGNASGHGALGQTGACHETLHTKGANHQAAVKTCGPT
jgi:hypothetical protein